MGTALVHLSAEAAGIRLQHLYDKDDTIKKLLEQQSEDEKIKEKFKKRMQISRRSIRQHETEINKAKKKIERHRQWIRECYQYIEKNRAASKRVTDRRKRTSRKIRVRKNQISTTVRRAIARESYEAVGIPVPDHLKRIKRLKDLADLAAHDQDQDQDQDTNR